MTDDQSCRSRIRFVSHEHLRAFVEAAPNPQLAVGVDGTIRLSNRHAEQLFGYQAHELKGRRVDTLIPPELGANHENHLKGFFSAPTQRQMGFGQDLEGMRRDGSRIRVVIGLSPVEAEGELLTVASLIDVTTQREAEAQTQRLTAELVRTNAELNDFAYVVSHDLREPLRGIRTYAEFLIEDFGEQLSGDGRNKLDSITRLTTRMDQLIAKLLDYSRRGRAELDLEPLPLDEIVQDVELDLDVMIRERDAEIRKPQPLPIVIADRSMMTELYANLIGNALKYTDKEERWVEVGCLSPDATDETLAPRAEPVPVGRGPVFYVRDNGIGIDPEHWTSVFRVFRRLHAKDAFGGGTGAGLTIAKKIVERHRGKIWLESVPGEGTTFYFRLGHPESGSSTKPRT
ncbi:MAG: PAS domain S-box protein [Candidatus Eisenbacteria bacterium]|uniref:histidine kinase n=1 Tax=Eiseniibacteriota bacterium TaxID=2212470 RepID=A0A956M324_UNCEI|nr:PAS domain S-box protein [Candidatus Eisenbacteria bacterium]